MSDIRIKSVEVKGLFNQFNYNFDFDNGEDISILIAPNGCGKTTIFKFVRFIFNPDFYDMLEIKDIPFESVTCILSNGKKVMLTKEEDTIKKSTTGLFSDSNEQEFDVYAKFKVFITDGEQAVASYHNPINVNREYTFSKRDYYLNFTSRAISIINTLREYDCFVDISFISADRLHVVEQKRYVGDPARNDFAHRFDLELPFDDEPEPRDRDSLTVAQEKLTNLLNDVNEKYNDKQSNAKDVLLFKYLIEGKKEYTLEEVQDKWKRYIHNLKKYKEIGLIKDVSFLVEPEQIPQYYENKGQFLSTYVDIFLGTLEPLEEQYSRLKLFRKIFNERNKVTQKEIRYENREIVLYVRGEKLPLSVLSSGEKHDFVMFFNLIFNSEDKDIVLIDEPEISLHISWQESYLDYLLEICELNGLQAIIATHSPSIVNGHFELYAKKTMQDTVDK